MIKSRKSQLHIEMIMSFVLFVGFVVAIFLFINPLKSTAVSPSNLNFVQEKILNNISVSYGHMPLVIKEGVVLEKSCFFVENPLASVNSVLVSDQSNQILNSRIDSLTKKIYLESSSTRFYNLYFSEVLAEHSLTDSDCQELSGENYSFGALITESVVLYENLLRLNELYNSDYISLKSNLNIQSHFDFIVYNFSKSLLFERTSKRDFGNANVLAREFVLNMINRENNKIEGIMNLRVA